MRQKLKIHFCPAGFQPKPVDLSRLAGSHPVLTSDDQHISAEFNNGSPTDGLGQGRPEFPDFFVQIIDLNWVDEVGVIAATNNDDNLGHVVFWWVKPNLKKKTIEFNEFGIEKLL